MANGENAKAFHIVSAYKNKKDTFSDVPVSNDPRRYVQDEHQSNVSNEIILENELSVKNNISIGGLDKEKDIESQSARVTDRNWLQKFVDWIKDLIASLKGVKQNQRLVDDLEYIEKRIARVLDSRDTKKAASRAGNVQYALKNPVLQMDIPWDEDNHSSIKKQIIDNQDKLNSMEPVANLTYDFANENFDKIIGREFEKIGNKVDIKNFGEVLLDKTAINKGTSSYPKTPAEKAAMLLVLKILKRGKIISGHRNHKENGFPTVTFGAPATVNGKRGNVGVAVKCAGRTRFNALRILMPDGSEFVLDKKIDAESTNVDVFTKFDKQGPTINSAPNYSIFNSDEEVKQKDIDNYVDAYNKIR